MLTSPDIVYHKENPKSAKPWLCVFSKGGILLQLLHPVCLKAAWRQWLASASRSPFRGDGRCPLRSTWLCSLESIDLVFYRNTGGNCKGVTNSSRNRNLPLLHMPSRANRMCGLPVPLLQKQLLSPWILFPLWASLR